MPRQPSSPSAPTGHKTAEPRDAILVLLDIVRRVSPGWKSGSLILKAVYRSAGPV
jgi:hypothetical protein